MQTISVTLLGAALGVTVLLGTCTSHGQETKPPARTNPSATANIPGSQAQEATKKPDNESNTVPEFLVLTIPMPFSDARQCLIETLGQRGWRVIAHREAGVRIRALRFMTSEEFLRATDSQQSNTRLSQGRAQLDAQLETLDKATRIKLQLRIFATGDAGQSVPRAPKLTQVPSTGTLERGLRVALQTSCVSEPH